ncbi:transposase [Streptomyces albidoflavus]
MLGLQPEEQVKATTTRAPGAPELTDAELLRLAVAQVLLGFPLNRHWLRFAHARPGHLFCGCGYCRSHSRFFWGFRLYLVTTTGDMPVTWCLANPKIGEREAMAALLERDHHLIRQGQVILADKGFAGKEFETFVSERLGAHLVRPDRKDEPVRHGKITRVRQWIEAVIDTLKGQLSLEQHGGRTPAGVFARTGQRLLALAAGVWELVVESRRTTPVFSAPFTLEASVTR